MSYYIDLKHDGLNKFRRIKGTDKWVVAQKASMQEELWNEQWARKQERENALQHKVSNKETALEQTKKALEALQEVDNLLIGSIDERNIFHWDLLYKKNQFSELEPELAALSAIPSEPESNDAKFIPKFNILDRIFKKRKQRKIETMEQKYIDAVKAWQEKSESIEKSNNELMKNNASEKAAWQARKKAFLKEQVSYNTNIKDRQEAYENKQVDAIIEYFDYVLSASRYPDSFPSKWEFEYRPENNLLIVDFLLPTPDELPVIKEIKYIQSRDEFKEVLISSSQANKLYDTALYKIALRTLNELFKADYIDALSFVVFNGWVISNDKATGNEINACVLSIQSKKDEFLKINLALVDPKVCFKGMKGVSCSNLYSLTPVPPIINLNRDDSRFIDSYMVASELDNSTNLASMYWEDFEHLIRELFQEEFSISGGEVKVTQASRDGGVDAVAFDPDPIRGGKIVIQAKRYTNTVGVAAVRDIYGTLLNEGANKGILVTTSDYGPDAYEFAKGKPITLLNGANLLYLLAKHGHRARINIKEAKQIQADEKKR